MTGWRLRNSEDVLTGLAKRPYLGRRIGPSDRADAEPPWNSGRGRFGQQLEDLLRTLQAGETSLVLGASGDAHPADRSSMGRWTGSAVLVGRLTTVPSCALRALDHDAAAVEIASHLTLRMFSP